MFVSFTGVRHLCRGLKPALPKIYITFFKLAFNSARVDATLLADNGATNYFRVDWFTPDGLEVWGDGRAFLLGTDGYNEMRKYIDVARSKDGDQVFLVDHKGERQFSVTGQVGFPFFAALILDSLNRTTKAYSQEMFFKAAELAVSAEQTATRIE